MVVTREADISTRQSSASRTTGPSESSSRASSADLVPYPPIDRKPTIPISSSDPLLQSRAPYVFPPEGVVLPVPSSHHPPPSHLCGSDTYLPSHQAISLPLHDSISSSPSVGSSYHAQNVDSTSSAGGASRPSTGGSHPAEAWSFPPPSQAYRHGSPYSRTLPTTHPPHLPPYLDHHPPATDVASFPDSTLPHAPPLYLPESCENPTLDSF